MAAAWTHRRGYKPGVGKEATAMIRAGTEGGSGHGDKWVRWLDSGNTFKAEVAQLAHRFNAILKTTQLKRKKIVHNIKLGGRQDFLDGLQLCKNHAPSVSLIGGPTLMGSRQFH